MTLKSKTIFLGFFIMGFAVLIYRCTGSSAMETIQNRGTLIAAVRNVPTVYYEGSDEKQGFEYELLRDFAKHLGVKLKLVVVNSIPELFQAVQDGTVDIGSGAITRTHAREKKYAFGPDYYGVKQVIVYKDGTAPIESISDLKNGTLEIVAHSSYEENLKKLKKTHPDLTWISNEKLSTDQLLEKVWKGELDYTIADDNIAKINRRYFPELVIGLPLTEEENLAWVLNTKLRGLDKLVDEWLSEYKLTLNMEDLVQRYFAHVVLFDYVNIRKFHNRIQTRLPEYLDTFRKAAEINNIPWTLLAAQSYQESHWSPRAKSPTGVRGMMMLTLTTARKMGVSSRLNPEESILGGAKYLNKLIHDLPASIQEDDRLLFALAAYNIGMGHLEDARIITQRLGFNPDRWIDVRDTLPLLSQNEFNKTVKHGYARGSEPVRYVDQILDYRDILENVWEAGLD